MEQACATLDHHLQFWSHDGATNLANLLLLWPNHHTLVHQHGFRLHLHPDRSLTALTAEGTAVPHHSTLPPHATGQRLDLGYAITVLIQQAA